MPPPVARAPPDDSPRPAGLSYRFAFLPCLVDASRARRWAVRLRAAASDAFFARADRSAAVIVSKLRLPVRVEDWCRCSVGPALSVAPRFRWECLTIRTVSWFPAPDTRFDSCFENWASFHDTAYDS